MIEKYAVAKEDVVEEKAIKLVKTGEAKDIEEAREKAMEQDDE